MDKQQKTPRAMTDVILDSIADGVFTVDLEWNITSLNRAGEKMLQIPREDAVGQKCFDVFRADLCQAGCPLRKSVDTGHELIDRRAEILRPDGSVLPVSVSTAVLRDEHGAVAGGAETFRDLSALERMRKEMRGHYTYEDIISRSSSIQRIFDILPDIAASGSTVLIEGASGTGKELFARAIHNLSGRRDRPFVAVNCGAIPDTLLESELFGHVKGAFTGADRNRQGRFARAAGGTLFCDEIGDVSPAMQVKLLRVLQEKRYTPLGSDTTVYADVRVIAATNRDLAARAAVGEFREDLYYRLNVIRLVLPPLADRREDVMLLAEHFIAAACERMGKRGVTLDADAAAALLRYPFPGNVRELQNAVEHAVILCRGDTITPAHLPDAIREYRDTEAPAPAENVNGRLEHQEADTILKVLAAHNGNRRRTAVELGIDPSTLWRKMKKYAIRFP